MTSRRRPSRSLAFRMPWKSLLEVLHRHDLPLGDVAQVRPRGQEDGGRELGQEMLGEVEIEVEPLQARQLLDLHLGEDHPSRFVLGVGQGEEAFGKQALLADLVGRHRGQTLPGHSLGQLRRRPDLDRLAAGHLDLIVGPRSEVVACLQDLLLSAQDRGLVGLVLGHHGGKALLSQQYGRHLVVARCGGWVLVAPSTVPDPGPRTWSGPMRMPGTPRGRTGMARNGSQRRGLARCDDCIHSSFCEWGDFCCEGGRRVARDITARTGAIGQPPAIIATRVFDSQISGTDVSATDPIRAGDTGIAAPVHLPGFPHGETEDEE